MKKRYLLVSAMMSFFLVACGGAKTYESNAFEQTSQAGSLSSFSLLSPTNEMVTTTLGAFTWEASDNATFYTLEVSTSPEFVTNDSDIVYLKRSNIATTSFSLSSSLTNKNCTYFWKVTANNGSKTKACDAVYSFYLQADNDLEIGIDIAEADDWSVHQAGSECDVSIDETDFFGNGKNSLCITFVEEKTNQGIPSSDGWMVITKTEEKDLYGTDALYFNFYYSGNDAKAAVRIVDNDGEYWYCPIQIANNSKQSIITKFSDYKLRTKDTPVMNMTFDYYHIKYFEIVFEGAFGDGVSLFSDIKAVRYDNYSSMFIQKFDFNSFDDASWGYESYSFDRTISESGNELTLSYSTSPIGENQKGIGSFGYGFSRLAINRYFADGDAVKMSVKYSGYYSSSSNLLFRILEQDNDRWQFKHPFSAMTKDEYTEVVIPFTAMTKTDYIYGDGARQFYYILNCQFGANGLYGNGSISFKDIEIVKLDDVVEKGATVIQPDGLIDDFSTYDYSAQMHYRWNLGTDNKDEAMSLETSVKVGGLDNKACAKLEYKSDMGMATYNTYIDCSQVASSDYNAISLWLKDSSEKKDSTLLNYLTSVCPSFTIQLSLATGERYRYTFEAITKVWTEYDIPFSAFELNNPEDFKEGAAPLTLDSIVNFAVGMQYFYYLEDGTPYPVYTSSNPVYMDEVRFVTASSLTKKVLVKVFEPDETDPSIVYIDDMEYADEQELGRYWFFGNGNPSGMALSDDVSSQGGTKSLAMQVSGGQASPSYTLPTVFSSACGGKALVFDLKGDGVSTVYVNIYVRNGSNLLQYRLTLTNVANVWKRYSYGFENIKAIDSGNANLLRSSVVPNIEKITFGMERKTDTEIAYIYADNIKFSSYLAYDAKSAIAL